MTRAAAAGLMEAAAGAEGGWAAALGVDDGLNYCDMAAAAREQQKPPRVLAKYQLHHYEAAQKLLVALLQVRSLGCWGLVQ